MPRTRCSAVFRERGLRARRRDRGGHAGDAAGRPCVDLAIAVPAAVGDPASPDALGGSGGPRVRPLSRVRFPAGRRTLPRLPDDPAGALVFRARDDRRAESRACPSRPSHRGVDVATTCANGSPQRATGDPARISAARLGRARRTSSPARASPRTRRRSSTRRDACALELVAEDRAQPLVLRRVVGDDSFATARVKVRGTIADGTIVARTLWPEDFRLDRAPPARTLAPDLPAALALRALIRGDPPAARGAPSPYGRCGSAIPRATPRCRDARCSGSWSMARRATTTRRTRGHFALVTGRDAATTARSAIGSSTISIRSTSRARKGIIAAPVPLDNYLADLNSGQGWYRPSHMLVAVLRDDACARARAGGAQPRLQPVLAPPARLPARDDELREHQRRRAARRSAGTFRHADRRAGCVAALAFPWFVAEGAIDRKGPHRVRLSVGGPDATACRRRRSRRSARACSALATAGVRTRAAPAGASRG